MPAAVLVRPCRWALLGEQSQDASHPGMSLCVPIPLRFAEVWCAVVCGGFRGLGGNLLTGVLVEGSSSGDRV